MEDQPTQTCLICGKEVPLNRGLCSTHHSRYYKEAKSLSKEQKQKYDQELIERGLLLPLQKPGPKVRENPFASIAQELFSAAESGSSYEKDGREKEKKQTKSAARKKSRKK